MAGNLISPLSMVQPVVDDAGRPLRNLNLFTEDVAKLDIIAGAGDPDGVVDARMKKLYMDTTGVAGSILYIKQVDEIGGDKTLGWVLV